MTETQLLQQRIDRLEGIINAFIKGDRYLFHKNIQLFDSMNLQLGTNTGTKIGTATTQKLAFYGNTPIAQKATRPLTVAGVTSDLASWGFYA